MNIEIERKFLVAGEGWKKFAGEGIACKQGYLAADKRKTVRVRILGDRGFLTVKGATEGISRAEFEYVIDYADAAAMLDLCDSVVEKTRYVFEQNGVTWELDVFEGANAGLVMAEVELESEDQAISLPDWAGAEVSRDPRYYNAYLAVHPYAAW